MKHKRILLIFLSLVLILSLLAGCKDQPTPDPVDTDKPVEAKTLTIVDTADEGNSYNIIYSGYATADVKAMAKDLQAAIKEETGVAIKYSTDTSKLTVESECEIILGKTTRPESVSALAKITGVGYRIERSEKKIVIVASNDDLLKQALTRFKELFAMENGNLTVTVGLESKESNDPTFPLVVDDKIPFRVVIPAKVANGYSDDLYNAAKDVCSFIEMYNHETVKVLMDDKVPEETDAYEICFGKTNRSASQKLYEELDNIFEYRIRLDGNRIVVGALIDDELVKGAKALYTDIARIFDGTYAGLPTLPLDYVDISTTSNVAKDFVLPDDGRLKGMLDCGKDSFILYYQQIKEQSQYEAYIEKLKSTGATVSATYEMGENFYTLLQHATYTSYVSYLSTQNVMRIYIGLADDVNPSTEPVKDAKLVTPKLWQFKIDVFAGGADGGMSYAIQLTDGKYLVFDGGYSEADAKELLATLVANKPANHKKPIVAGWFISHLHGDHFYGFQAMASNHADDIEVEAFYYNFPYVSMGETQTVSPGTASSVEQSMRKWPTAKRCRKLHSGEDIYFSGATVKVICTLEDLFPFYYGDGNDTSTVVQVQIAGQKILILGDAMSSESAAMVKLGSEVLKSDIVQFSHHGYNGATVSVYAMADPETVLWPMCILASGNHSNTNLFRQYYVGKFTLDANAWVRDSESVKKVIVSGAGTTCLKLPYYPSGEKIVDYDAIYQQQLAEYNASKTN